MKFKDYLKSKVLNISLLIVVLIFLSQNIKAENQFIKLLYREEALEYNNDGF